MEVAWVGVGYSAPGGLVGGQLLRHGDAGVMPRGDAARMGGARREHGGILILRAWAEERQLGTLRIRISRVVDRNELPVVTVAEIEEACVIVRGWLDGLLDPGRARDPALPPPVTPE